MTKKYSRNRCDVLAGAGSNSTREALEYSRNALDSGVDKVLLVDCYYNGPSSLELRDEYYAPILEALNDIKIVIYVIPGRTGTAISPADIAVLDARYGRVVAIKEATGDFTRMEEERSLMPDMSIMSGDDDKTFEMMTRKGIKAEGVISVISNIAPKAVSEMVESIASGNIDRGEQLERSLKPLFSIVTVKAKTKRTLPGGREVIVEDRFRNPLAIKSIMKVLGMQSGVPRKPVGKLSTGGTAVVRDALKKVFEESFDILKPVEEFYGVNIEERLNDDALWEALTYPS
jgi:4-hydroxy-tetrahydrodipicolinate synthase